MMMKDRSGGKYFSVALVKSFHRVNAVFIAAFLLIHIGNHLSGVFGIETYNSVQNALRTVYRAPILEILLIFAAVAQLVAGAALAFNALRREFPRGFWPRAQLISGIIFFLFLAQHLFSLGMTRLYFDLETDFFWPASVMNGPPFVYYFIPYYFLGVLAGMTHIGAGVRFLLIDSGRKTLAEAIGAGSIVFGVIAGALIVFILSGAFFDITLPPDWVEYLRWYWPAYGAQ